MKRALVAALAFLLWFAAARMARAEQGYPDAYLATGSPCQDCHVIQTPTITSNALNAFGNQWQNSSCFKQPFTSFLCGTSGLPAADADRDGYTNLEEVESGTNLFNGGSVPSSLDECRFQTCIGAAQCHDTNLSTPNTWTCSCPPGYTSQGSDKTTTCTSLCDPKPCTDPAAQCQLTQAGDYNCVCPSVGYTTSTPGHATTCTRIDECVNNGGCDPNATCLNTNPGAHSCTCKAGYYGTGTTVTPKSCSLTNLCLPGVCPGETTCKQQGTTCSCADCPQGYAAKPASAGGKCSGPSACQDIDECATNNGGCDPATKCTNTPGFRTCGPCPAGMSGDGVSGCAATACDALCAPHAVCDPTQTTGCTCLPGYTGDGKTCTDTDECQSGVCSGAECSNLPGAYLCRCDAGDAGAHPGMAAPPGPKPPSGPAGPVAPNGLWLVFGACAAAAALAASSVRRVRRPALASALAFAIAIPLACGGGGGGSNGSGDAGPDSGALDGSTAGSGTAGSGTAGNGTKPSSDAGPGAADASAGTGGGSAEAGPTPDAGAACTASCQCPDGDWCNPGTQACESRTPPTPIAFDDVRAVLAKVGCTGCHYAGGAGDVDPEKVGKTLDMFSSPPVGFASVVAGGVNCTAGPHRVCVDEPASSLLATQTLDTPGNQGKPSVTFESWSDPDLQTILRWIASGAPRKPEGGSCGDYVKQAGEDCDEGPNPPTECPYGAATCQLCDASCKAHAGTPRVCGDNHTDVGYETCDDANTTLEQVDVHGGNTCGPSCTLVAAQPCGANGLACCTTSPACDPTEECDAGKCKPICGQVGTPCCDHAVADGHTDGCVDYGMCVSNVCQACGTTGTQCCGYATHNYSYMLLESHDACDDVNSVCDHGYLCDACGYEGEPCCPSVTAACHNDTTGSVTQVRACFPYEGPAAGEARCYSCGGLGQDCCPYPYNPGDPAQCYGSTSCQNDTCGACGGSGEPCCTDGSCQGALACADSLRCHPKPNAIDQLGQCSPSCTACGGLNEPCCTIGSSCAQTDHPSGKALACDASTSQCKACGSAGLPCPVCGELGVQPCAVNTGALVCAYAPTGGACQAWCESATHQLWWQPTSDETDPNVGYFTCGYPYF